MSLAVFLTQLACPARWQPSIQLRSAMATVGNSEKRLLEGLLSSCSALLSDVLRANVAY